MASGRHEIVLHQAVITEVAYVLQNLYKQTPTWISATALLNLPTVAPWWPPPTDLPVSSAPNGRGGALPSTQEGIRWRDSLIRCSADCVWARKSGFL